MVTVLRPLSTSELLDRTFHLYRNNFVVFAGIAALPQLVVLALQLAFSGLIFAGALSSVGGEHWGRDEHNRSRRGSGKGGQHETSQHRMPSRRQRVCPWGR